MPNSMIKINYQCCNPAHCNSGVCVAAKSCPLKLIEQEEPFDIPMSNYPDLCKGCAKCVTACPLQAISLV